MPNTHFRGGRDYGVRHLSARRSDSLEILMREALAEPDAPTPQPLGARDLILLGAVYVEDERILNPDALIRAGSMIRVHAQPRRYPQIATMRLRIVRETPDYIVVDKPAGLPVHAMVDNAKENLLSYLEAELSRRLFITHRLDVETSGLLLIALTPSAQSELNKKLAAKSIKRHYLAFTQTRVALATYIHFMDDSPRAPKTLHDEPGEARQRCELTVDACAEVSREALADLWTIDKLSAAPIYQLSIELGTGRTQQIRAQLKHLQASIIGDTLYENENCLLDRLTLSRAIALRADALFIP